MNIQAILVATVIAVTSFEANCDPIRFEFDGVVTFTRQNIVQTPIQPGDVISGYVDMEPDLAPPPYLLGSALAGYPIEPSIQPWVNGEILVGGVTYQPAGLIPYSGVITIIDDGIYDSYELFVAFQDPVSSYYPAETMHLEGDINLNEAPSLAPSFITGIGLEQSFTWNRESDNYGPPRGKFTYFHIEENKFLDLDFSFQRVKVGPVLSITPVDLSGTIKTADGTDICAMVLASGQFTFSCNPIGVFSLTDLPTAADGTVKRQIYADGLFPEVDTLAGSSVDAVVMTRSGTCPDYNTPYLPADVPGSAGKRIDITGKILLQNSLTPICAMVLANGQYTFSCDGTGSYALNIPLDSNGQFKLQVYADGFAPITQMFDEFQTLNDVRMARAAECQTGPAPPPPPPPPSTG